MMVVALVVSFHLIAWLGMSLSFHLMLITMVVVLVVSVYLIAWLDVSLDAYDDDGDGGGYGCDGCSSVCPSGWLAG